MLDIRHGEAASSERCGGLPNVSPGGSGGLWKDGERTDNGSVLPVRIHLHMPHTSTT